jgi:hypothetical protein
MTGMSSNKWRYAAVGFSVIAFASGCSSSDGTDGADATVPGTDVASTDPASTDPASTQPASTDPASTDPASTEPASTGPTIPAAEAEQTLQEAVDAAVEAGYDFVTTVTAGGGLAIQAEGDRLGDSARFVVTRDDAVVEYVVTADGTWARPDGGEWGPIDAPTATVDPLPALVGATSIASGPSSEGGPTIVATLPDSALGYADDRDLELTVTVVDGAITEIRYDTTVQGLAASVVTRLSPPTDDSPVVAPI